jgi:hypothetical protein
MTMFHLAIVLRVIFDNFCSKINFSFEIFLYIKISHFQSFLMELNLGIEPSSLPYHSSVIANILIQHNLKWYPWQDSNLHMRR